MKIAALVFMLSMFLGCQGMQAGGQKAAGVEKFEWKCLWVWSLTRKTQADAEKEVAQARALGFNVIAVQASPAYMKLVVAEGHKQGLQVYEVHTAPYGEWGFPKLGAVKAPEGCVQEYSAEELKKLSVQTDPDKPVAPGPWLCIDRPEARKYAADLAAAMVKEHGVDGVALDWVGYRNYRGCHCAYSDAERVKFAAAHPTMTAAEVEKEFSLQQIKRYYSEVREAVLKENPKAQLMCHIYPQFDPDEFYGNQLPVEYPAQTVAWFFKPHWPMEKVEKNCATVKRDEHKWHKYNTATGFTGLDMEANSVKTPERLRAELRAMKAAGLKGFCVAGGAEFLKDPGLSAVFADEVGVINVKVTTKDVSKSK